MNIKKVVFYYISLIALLVFLLVITACNPESSLTSPTEINTSTQSLLKQLIEEDESYQSFELNYNEEDVMDFEGSLPKAIIPVKVGQRMKLVEKTHDFVFNEDSTEAVVTSTRIFEGKMKIAGSYDEFTRGDSGIVDTIVEKIYTTTITHVAKLEKVQETIFPKRNWKLTEISLMDGGTGSQDIMISKLTVTPEDGEIMEVTDPNSYFTTRMAGRKKHVPFMRGGEEVTVTVEILSAFEDDDFVTMTRGAVKGKKHRRAKSKFELVSSETDPETGLYKKVYENTIRIFGHRGHRHAVVNVMTKQSIYDDSAFVEQDSWGIPYQVN